MALRIKIPDLVEAPLALEPETRRVKGGVDTMPTTLNRLEGWVSIGKPWCVPLTPDVAGDDRDLRRFALAQAGDHRFTFVALTCTFAPEAEAEFVKAWVRVQLASLDGPSGQLPIAYSMQPVRGNTPDQVTRTVNVGSDFKLIQPSAAMQITRSVEKLYVEALYEGQSNPVWELSRTAGASISGVQRFSLVVQQPPTGTGTGAVTVLATVERKRFGIFSYRGSSPDPRELTFQLP